MAERGPSPDPEAAARVVRNGLALGGSKAATAVVLFAWQVMVARLLGPGSYGVYAVLAAGLALAAVLPDFGLGLVVARDAAKRPRDAPRLLAATLLLQPSLAALTALAAVAAGWGFTASRGIGPLIVLAALPLVTDALGNLCHAQLVAAERLVGASAIALLHAGVLVAVGLPLVAGGLGLWGVYGAILAASLVRAVVYWRLLAARGLAPAWPAEVPLLLELLREGWPIALLALVGNARMYGDRLLVTPLLGVAAAGQLQAAFVVAFGLGDLLNATLLTVVLPAMARAFHDRRQGEFDRLVERLAAAGLVVGVPLVFAAALFGPALSAALFGPGFEDTPRLMVVLLAALAATMTGNAFQQVLIVGGRQRVLLAIRGAALAGQLLLIVLLVPEVGLIGAALAALATEVAAAVALAAVVRPPAASLRRLARAGLAATASAAVAAAAARAIDPGAGPAALAIMAVLVVAGYVALRVVPGEELRLLLATGRVLLRPRKDR